MLDVSQNNLRALPKELGDMTSLVELCASGNRCKTVPEELGRLTRPQRDPDQTSDLKSEQDPGRATSSR